MKKYFFIIYILIHSIGYSQTDQINAFTAGSIQELQDYLNGEGVNIYNVTVSTNSESANVGTFEAPEEKLGIAEGFVISSENLPGSSNISTSNISNADHDLVDALDQSQEGINDITILEFDIDVASNKLSFDYVFISEEYPEYTGCGSSSSNGLFSDVFGFFISGPGISGEKNLALVPGTSTPISVGTINECTNKGYYINKHNASINQQLASNEYNPSENPYRGWTKVLTAETNVIPCETYHLKLAAADVGDLALRTSVMIKGNSFSSRYDPGLDVEYEYESLSTTIEGCAGATIFFRRGDQQFESFNEDLFLQLTFEDSASAKFGEDFTMETSFTIPGGVNEISVPFTAMVDDTIEGNEVAVINMTSTTCINSTTTDQVTVNIRDSIIYPLPDVTGCQFDSITLNPLMNIEDSLIWEVVSGISCDTCNNPLLYLTKPDTISYTYIHKSSGCTVDDSLVATTNGLFVDFTAEIDSLNYSTADVILTNNSSGSDSYLWDFGDCSTSTEFEPAHLYNLALESKNEMFVISLTGTTEELGCEATVYDTIIVSAPFFIPNLVTSNGDELNDYFDILGIAKGRWTITIYNRWGQTVYYDENYNLDWDGDDQSEGVYFYEIVNPIGDRSYNGWIQLFTK